MQSHLRQEDQELKLLSRFEAAWAVYFLKKKCTTLFIMSHSHPPPFLPLCVVNLPEGNGILLVVSSWQLIQHFHHKLKDC